MKHTPTPLLMAYDETIKMWVVFYNQDRPDSLGERDFETGEKLSPVMCDQIDVARCQTQEQAQLIVTAVNSHFELLEALKSVRRHGLIESDGYETIVRQVGEAISQAEGKS